MVTVTFYGKDIDLSLYVYRRLRLFRRGIKLVASRGDDVAPVMDRIKACEEFLASLAVRL